MTCHRIDLGDGTFAIACTRGPRRKAAPCLYCGKREHTKLCDHEVSPGKTCDRKLCEACAVHVGPNRDLCPDHAKVARQQNLPGVKP